MPRLHHRLVAVRTVLDDDVEDRNEYGHPVARSVRTIAFRGLVQPKTVEQMAQQQSAGVVVSDHVIFAYPLDLHEPDYIAHADPANPTQIDPADPRRYEVDGVRDAGGAGHHLEIDVHMILP